MLCRRVDWCSSAILLHVGCSAPAYLDDADRSTGELESRASMLMENEFSLGDDRLLGQNAVSVGSSNLALD